MKKHISTIIVAMIFICGLSLFLYPTFSNLYNEYLNKKLIGEYQKAFEGTTKEQYNEALKQAKLYNENKDNEDKLQELGLAYEEMLNLADNGIMGYVEIPKISVSLVIYHSIEESVLQKGIGHIPTSHLPVGGESTHSVLVGHTGLPSAKLLTNIDHLDIGDKFYIHVLDEVLEYQIDDISVVEPDEVSRLNVISGKDCVTLVTCTPYGVNSHRLLVRGVRGNGNSNLQSDDLWIPNELMNVDITTLITFSLIGLVIVTFSVWKIVSVRKKKKRVKEEREENNE